MLTSSDWQRLLTALVAPRPIAWVSTLSRSGAVNLAPFSCYAPICDDPPTLLLGVQRRSDGRRKHTAQNLLDTRQCSIAVVNRTLAERMVMTSSERDGDEFELANVAAERCATIDAPRVADAPATFECVLGNHVAVHGVTDCFFLMVTALWIAEFRITDLTQDVFDAARSIAFVGACAIEEYVTPAGTLSIKNPID